MKCNMRTVHTLLETTIAGTPGPHEAPRSWLKPHDFIPGVPLGKAGLVDRQSVSHRVSCEGSHTR